MKDWFELICNQCENYLEVSILQRDGDKLLIGDIHVYCATCRGGCMLETFVRWERIENELIISTEPDPQTADETDSEE